MLVLDETMLSSFFDVRNKNFIANSSTGRLLRKLMMFTVLYKKQEAEKKTGDIASSLYHSPITDPYRHFLNAQTALAHLNRNSRYEAT
jgi:hypothetical protein